MSGHLFSRQIAVIVDRTLSPQAISATLARTAREGVARAIASGAAPAMYTRYVDGREGAPEESVRPDGVIYYAFNLLPDLILFLIGFLRERSPRGLADGVAFRDSFFIGVDGRLVRPQDFRAAKVPPRAEIIIGNTVPYNRLVDVQMAGQRRVRYAVPPNIYLDAAAAAERRFGGAFRVVRLYNVVFPGKYVLKTGDRRGKPVYSPGILIEPKGGAA